MRKVIALFVILWFFILTPSILADDGQINTRVEVSASTNTDSVTDAVQETIRQREELQVQREKKLQDARDLASFRFNQSRETLMDKLNKLLAELNARWVDRWEMNYNRLSKILIKVESRAQRMESAGYDVAEAREEISLARASLDDAYRSINALMEKEYLITDPDNIREEFIVLKEQMRADHGAVKDLLVAAKDHMHAAVKIMKGLVSADDSGPVSTPREINPLN